MTYLIDDVVNGVVTTRDATPEEAADIDARKASAFSNYKADCVGSIDDDADDIRRAVLGARTTEYQQAETDADNFKTAGYTGTVPDSVQSWLNAKNAVGANWTAQQAADDILTTASQWRSAQTQIRFNRLLRKEQAKAAPTQVDLDTAMSAWRTFRDQMRSQLGLPPV